MRWYLDVHAFLRQLVRLQDCWLRPYLHHEHFVVAGMWTQSGPSPDNDDSVMTGSTALHIAAHEGALECVTVLLERGLPVDTPTVGALACWCTGELIPISESLCVLRHCGGACM